MSAVSLSVRSTTVVIASTSYFLGFGLAAFVYSVANVIRNGTCLSGKLGAIYIAALDLGSVISGIGSELGLISVVDVSVVLGIVSTVGDVSICCVLDALVSGSVVGFVSVTVHDGAIDHDAISIIASTRNQSRSSSKCFDRIGLTWSLSMLLRYLSYPCCSGRFLSGLGALLAGTALIIGWSHLLATFGHIGALSVVNGVLVELSVLLVLYASMYLRYYNVLTRYAGAGSYYQYGDQVDTINKLSSSINVSEIPSASDASAVTPAASDDNTGGIRKKTISNTSTSISSEEGYEPRVTKKGRVIKSYESRCRFTYVLAG